MQCLGTKKRQKNGFQTETSPLNLSKQECDIIELFIKNPERKISKDELKQRIWTNEQNSDNIVPMYMTFLQEKFNALNANIKINDIEGYKLEKMI